MFDVLSSTKSRPFRLQFLPAGGAWRGEGCGGDENGQWNARWCCTWFRIRDITQTSRSGGHRGLRNGNNDCVSGLERIVQGTLQDWRWRVFVQLWFIAVLQLRGSGLFKRMRIPRDGGARSQNRLYIVRVMLFFVFWLELVLVLSLYKYSLYISYSKSCCESLVQYCKEHKKKTIRNRKKKLQYEGGEEGWGREAKNSLCESINL